MALRLTPRAHSLGHIISFIILCSILFEDKKITINDANIVFMGIWEVAMYIMNN